MVSVKNRRRFNVLNVERLESKEVPAAFVFSAGTSNDWATASNWTVGGVVQTTTPGSADDVEIPASKIANFNVAADVTIKSLTMKAGSVLDLGKVTAQGKQLIVDGNGTSTIGETTGTPVGIMDNQATTFSPATYQGGELTFKGTQTVNVNKATLNFYNPIIGGYANTVNFRSDKTNFGDGITTEATVVVGGVSGSQVISYSGSFNLGNKGRMILWPAATLILKEGANISISATNPVKTIDTDDGGNTIAVTGNAQMSNVTLRLKGAANLLVFGGEYKGGLVAFSSSKTVVWAGSVLTSNTNLEFLFMSDSNVAFVSDVETPTAGVGLYGKFTLSHANSIFHCWRQTKPSATTPQTWAWDNQTTNKTSFSVVLDKDYSMRCSWSDSYSNQKFNFMYNAAGTDSGVVKFRSNFDNTINITNGNLIAIGNGNYPASTNLSLIKSPTMQTTSFATKSITGGPTTSYTNADDFGLSN